MMTTQTVTTLEDVKPPVKDREALLRDFIKQSGFAEHSIDKLAGDASFRRYVRVTTPKTSYVVMDSPPNSEPIRPYIRVCDYLCKQGYSAPRIIALDEESGFLLLEDLGDDVFNAMLSADDDKAKALEHELYKQSVELLVDWHKSPEMLKATSSLKIPDYNLDAYMKELRLFTDWYLPELNHSEATFRSAEFLDICANILTQIPLAGCYFVHRDFHANNLVWLNGRKGDNRVGLLDFQDALWGDPSYDLVSLLEDARRDVSPELAKEMKELYIQLSGQPRTLFEKRYAIMGAQRNLKIIGIFSRLNKRDNKPQYLDYLPRVWRYLERDLEHPALAKLKIWLDGFVPQDLRG